MNSEVISLFPTPVVKTSLGRDFTEDEMRTISNIPMIKKSEVKMEFLKNKTIVSNANHQSVNHTLFDNFAEELKDIKLFCEYELKKYLEHIEGIDTNLAGLRITQSWLNNNKPQEQHLPHFHKNSYLSGVFYFKCLSNDGINFDNGRDQYNNMELLKDKNTIFNTKIAFIDVIEGDLVIFPSWIPHFVNVNETKDTERISLSFNTFPIGELGDYDGLTHLKL